VVVTTPQRLSRVDVLKGIAMLSELRVPVVSLVENMSYFTDPQGGVLGLGFGLG
jgi:ATP-binding protein involved in chromosome partitioning